MTIFVVLYNTRQIDPNIFIVSNMQKRLCCYRLTARSTFEVTLVERFNAGRAFPHSAKGV